MVTIRSPYEDSGTWLRGNVHAHTTESDGTRPPKDVIDDYAARGYDFLAISDHDTLVDPDEYRPQTGMVLVPAVEVSSGGPHLQHVGASTVVDPDEDRQAVVDAIDEHDDFAVANHPKWLHEFEHWPREELARTEGFDGIEIYNGLIQRHAGAARATDRWDWLLSKGHRLWGVAADDSHRGGDVEQGWTVVQSDERTPAAILDALRNGRFYSSTGVTVETIGVDEDELVVSTADADRIRLISDHGVVQQTVDRPTAAFHLPEQLVRGGDHSYVRVECLGRGGDAAWTQPMFLES